MNALLGASVALALLVGTAHGMGSKPSGGTGDKEFDATLEEIGVEAKNDTDGFIRRLGSRYHIPEQDIRNAMGTTGLSHSDMFMSAALAQATRRPVLTVAERYRENPGKGWGVMAKNQGIHPGSREFHELKRGARGFLDDLRATAASKQKHEQEMKQERERTTKKEPPDKDRGKP